MLFYCAHDETRTHTGLLPLPPQSSVYTNFTTCALKLLEKLSEYSPIFYKKQEKNSLKIN